MSQRTALVTGGMGGLGEAICMKLARMGVKVVISSTPSNTTHKESQTPMDYRDYKYYA
jgi:acetoacetyl-CoA reductase